MVQCTHHARWIQVAVQFANKCVCFSKIGGMQNPIMNLSLALAQQIISQLFGEAPLMGREHQVHTCCPNPPSAIPTPKLGMHAKQKVGGSSAVPEGQGRLWLVWLKLFGNKFWQSVARATQPTPCHETWHAGQTKSVVQLSSLDALRCSGKSDREQLISLVVKEELTRLGPTRPPHAHGTAPEGTTSLDMLVPLLSLADGKSYCSCG
eukprot:1158735-Pelagomonas_calceolata.AAC.4